MKKITKDLELCKFNGVVATYVYVGGLNYLKPVKLKWRKKEWGYGIREVELLKLSEIVEQLGEGQLITIFTDEPFRGKILQYENCGDEWYEMGTICGYA